MIKEYSWNPLEDFFHRRAREDFSFFLLVSLNGRISVAGNSMKFSWSALKVPSSLVSLLLNCFFSIFLKVVSKIPVWLQPWWPWLGNVHRYIHRLNDILQLFNSQKKFHR